MITEYYPSSRKKKVTPPAPAFKSDLSVKDYAARCAAVLEEARKCELFVGDVGFPTVPADLIKYGECRVVGICWSYANYGDVAWNDPPFILSVSPLKSPGTVINCTVNWLERAPLCLTC